MHVCIYMGWASLCVWAFMEMGNKPFHLVCGYLVCFHLYRSMMCDSRAAAAAGTKTWADGRVYEGEWKDNIQNGKGEERGGAGTQSRARGDEG